MDLKVFDTLLDGVVILDKKLNIIYANEAMGSLSEMPVKRFKVGDPIGKYLQFNPPIFEAIDLSNLKDASTYVEVVMKAASGAEARVRISAQPVSGKTTDQFVLYIRDVTLEETLQRKYRGELLQKEDFIRQLESALEDVSLKKNELDRKVYEITLLLEISKVLNGLKDREGLLTEVVKKFFDLKVCSEALVFLPDDLKKVFRAVEFRSSRSEKFDRPVIEIPFHEIGDDLAHLFKGGKQNSKINPKAFEIIKKYFKKDVDELLTMSLSTTHYAAGSIHIVRNANDRKLTDEDINLFSSISSQVAIALESIRFFESSITDEMTQIYNKRYFISRLENEVAKADRHSEPMSLLFFDVDHFKKLNDTYGHQAGDLVLKTLAQNVRLNCRKYDIPARYGGEEFVLVLPKTAPPGALIIAERIRKGVEGMRVQFDGQDLSCTISIGIASFPDHADTSEGLISAADKALYLAKGSGRNRTLSFSKAKKKSA
jgi:diguanylate cyclase (GGDEF)-like protein